MSFFTCLGYILRVSGYTTTTLKYLVLTFGTIIGGWILAGVFVILLALLIDKIGYSMSWFTNTWLIFGLYVIPTVGLSTFPLSIKFRVSESVGYLKSVMCIIGIIDI